MCFSVGWFCLLVCWSPPPLWLVVAALVTVVVAVVVAVVVVVVAKNGDPFVRLGARRAN